MKGTVLGIDPTTEEAVINAEDGARYKAATGEWRHGEPPTAGQRVDFAVADGRAVEVFLDVPASGTPAAAQQSPGLRVDGTNWGNIGLSVGSPEPATLNLTGLSPRYQAEFQKIWDSGESYKGSWNWMAFLFGLFWAASKGLTVSVVVCLVAGVLTAGIGFIVYWFIYGYRGTFMYYNLHVRQKQLPA